ncbi:MAG TPA: alpha/beta hydrolase [Mycobacteriales bacterium]|nr:alpha/beta hydrolase [Mycobacteriales bacterium]
MRRTVLVTFVAALAVAGCTSVDGNGRYGGDPIPGAPAPSSAAPASPTISPVTFDDCTSVIKPQVKDSPGGDRPLSFGCGKLRVPLDYRDPSRKAIDLFLLRVRIAGQQKKIGSLVVNPGGPGGSGVDAAVGLGLSLPTDVLKRFDLVGFDPRGVGLSAPVECISGTLKDQAAALDPDARTETAYRAQVALAKEISTSCLSKYGDDLQHYNTEETARDLDLVRQGVGDARLTYLGYSYGTRLGSVYAQLFPKRVRALVLDGAVDPKQGEVASAQTQAAGFERAFDQFAADCKARNAACLIGPDPRAAVNRLLATARKAPIPGGSGGRKATAGHVLLAVVSALYDRGDWAELESALADATNGNASGLFTLADRYNQRDPKGDYTNLTDANIAINCADSAEKVPDATVRRTLASWRSKYPLFGTSLALGLLTCQQWTAPRQPLPPVKAAGAPPLLVVGTVHDPATPYASAQVLARTLATGHLLTWQGEGHTAYPKTPCVTAAVNAYLVSLKVPGRNASCAAA